MNQDVFLSILAMDSYNRGYGQNVGGLSSSGQLGAATIIRQSDVRAGSAALTAGFYAIAYAWNGNKVISYRGTNPEFTAPDGQTFLDSPLVKDAWNGWTLGAGYIGAAQGGMAIKFYEDVSSRSIYNPVGNGTPILLTGHSLGGGLAGFVGALSSNQAYGFDHMPYGIAAWAQVLSESIRRAANELNLTAPTIGDLLAGIETGVLPQIVDGTITVATFAQHLADNLHDLAPFTASLTGYNIDGEVLGNVRDGTAQVAIGGIGGGLAALLGFPILGAAIAAAGGTLAYTTVQLEGDVEHNLLTVYGADLGTVTKHSISLLTTILFGEKQWSPNNVWADWKSSIKYILPATLDDGLANSAFGLAADKTGLASALVV